MPGQFGKTMGELIMEQAIRDARRKRFAVYVVTILIVCALVKYLFL